MTVQAEQIEQPDGDATQAPAAKRAYRRPELQKLGSLRDMTLKLSQWGTPDGMPRKGTGRGGDC
jgi:hypothetical protein